MSSQRVPDAESIKMAMEQERRWVRDRIVMVLRENKHATTSALRKLFAQFAGAHRKSLFWLHLSELERQGVIARAGLVQVRNWHHPETLWQLSTTHLALVARQ